VPAADRRELIRGNNTILLQYYRGNTVLLQVTSSSFVSALSDHSISNADIPFLNPKTWKGVTSSAVKRINYNSLVYRRVPARYTLFSANSLIRLVLPSLKVQNLNHLVFQLFNILLSDCYTKMRPNCFSRCIPRSLGQT
jgi:hypothetical protein